MITTTQQSTQYNFRISGLINNGKSLLSAESIPTQKQISSRFEIAFSDFDYTFNFEIVKISRSLESNNIILYLKLFEDVIVKATLFGYWTKQKEPDFYFQKFNIEVEKNYETPTPVFLLSTLWAMLNLSDTVKFTIPALKHSFTNSFSLSLDKISDFLQDRQIAYRLMVIEKALKVSLPLPNGFISGIDIENIAFCFHAIIEREFEWLCNPGTFLWTSTTEYSDLLPSTNLPSPLTFPTQDEKRVVFGHSLNLRQLLVEIEQAKVVNYEEAKQKLLELNGEPVEIIVKSGSGKMRYKAKNVPALPKNAFSREIQKLIDLDSKLDAIVLDKYFALATSAFEGLTEEQKEAILERPNLDEDAFDF